MNTFHSCPKCFSEIQLEEHGDLIDSRCTACDWHETTIVARAFPEHARSFPVEVNVSALGTPSVPALKALRRYSPQARNLPLEALKESLSRGQNFAVGSLAEFRAREVQAELASVGFQVTCSRENAG